MSQWIFFLVLATCALGSLGDDLADKIAFKNATFDRCKKQMKVPDAAMDDVYHSRSLEGVKDIKCVTKCIAEGYGVFKDGQMRPEMLAAVLKGHWPDEKAARIITSSLECLRTVEKKPDICDYIYDGFGCFFGVLQKERTEYTK